MKSYAFQCVSLSPHDGIPLIVDGGLFINSMSSLGVPEGDERQHQVKGRKVEQRESLQMKLKQSQNSDPWKMTRTLSLIPLIQRKR